MITPTSFIWATFGPTPSWFWNCSSSILLLFLGSLLYINCIQLIWRHTPRKLINETIFAFFIIKCSNSTTRFRPLLSSWSACSRMLGLSCEAIHDLLLLEVELLFQVIRVTNLVDECTFQQFVSRDCGINDSVPAVDSDVLRCKWFQFGGDSFFVFIFLNRI